jgi:hypothetical protein
LLQQRQCAVGVAPPGHFRKDNHRYHRKTLIMKLSAKALSLANLVWAGVCAPAPNTAQSGRSKHINPRYRAIS